MLKTHKANDMLKVISAGKNVTPIKRGAASLSL